MQWLTSCRACRTSAFPSPKGKAGQASMSAYLRPVNGTGGLDLQPTQRIKKPSDSMAARRYRTLAYYVAWLISCHRSRPC